MPVLSAHQIITLLQVEACPDKRLIAWAAVSFCESSWNTQAVSPTSARGLYQLEPYSWPAGAGSFDKWDNPDVNTRAALILSGYGMNFAPWDTAYADIQASGRYSFLNWPERGSCAWNHFGYVAAILGTGVGGSYTPPVQPGVSGTLQDALGFYDSATRATLPAMTRQTRVLRVRARRSLGGRR
jgi:hypothetical protein